ncbi:dihydropyrimidinase [soil metagenome]
MIIANGKVVTAGETRAVDVVVDGGKVVGLVEPGSGPPGHEVVDAAGAYVLPGGVDPHVHALSGTAPATLSGSVGGTTTLLSFTLPHPTESPAEGLTRARDEEVPLSPVDMGLHASYLKPGMVSFEQLSELRDLGVSGIKVFLAYPELGIMFTDGPLFELLRSAAALELRVQVHCEVGEVIEVLVGEYQAAGRREVCCFAETRPVEVEDEAVRRTLTLAEYVDAAVYIVHMTTAGGLEAVREARRAGVDVKAEACTHHLLLDESRYKGEAPERFLIAPPLRPIEHVEALWEAVADGTLDTIGSDHSQVLYHHPGANPDDFTSKPYGFPGAELRMPLILSEGLKRGVSIERLVDLLCTGPAKAFGHHPRKGTLGVGADADILIWDPEVSWVVDAAKLHDGWGISPYEGWEVQGAVRAVYLRGELVAADGEPVGTPAGAFLASVRPPLAAAPITGG